MSSPARAVAGDLPWTCPLAAGAPTALAEGLQHARNFSELLHGAALLYNLVLAELVNAARRGGGDADLAVDADLTAHSHDLLAGWAERIAGRLPAYESWNRPAFWQLVAARNPRVSPRARAVIERWVDLAVRHRGDIYDPDARDLVREREVAVKRSLARVTNMRALERWNGASGTAQLTFRWPQGRQFAIDVLDGLGAR